MLTTKKLVLACVSTVVFSMATYAQKGQIDINGGGDVAIALGDFGEGYGTGFGATVKGLYGISDNGKVGLTLGYIHFGSKEDLGKGNSASFGVIPVLALYRHQFGSLYVEPQLGFSSNRASVDLSGLGSMGGSMGAMSVSTTSLGYAAGVGYLIGDIDLSARYQGFSSGGSAGFAGLRVAYNFSL